MFSYTCVQTFSHFYEPYLVVVNFSSQRLWHFSLLNTSFDSYNSHMEVAIISPTLQI